MDGTSFNGLNTTWHKHLCAKSSAASAQRGAAGRNGGHTSHTSWKLRKGYGKVTDRVNLESFAIKRHQFGERLFFCLIIPGNRIEIRASSLGQN